ncbi:thrombin inhibitor hemalin-like [Clavelina lepadiformis]|uniref:BPTI/Kunitz inhibitor domain-containing protein n=1 Tax=Clavelina lepadiformis TaxID=159417 RepID=A0ABP0GU54_CLALP
MLSTYYLILLCTFMTGSLCQPKDCHSCLQQVDIGNCDGIFPRWYFNTTTSQCQIFEYGGCGGNANNFLTLEQCKDKCSDLRLSFNPDCNQCPDSGPCEAAIKKWFFNAFTGRCEEFIYGGCLGNFNMFSNRWQCVWKCRYFYK